MQRFMTDPTTPRIIRVAVPKPLRMLFDYTVPDGFDPVSGGRVRVPFGRGSVVGLCVGWAETAATAVPLKPIESVIDPEPLLPSDLMTLGRWAADYYQHPIGDVLFSALPAALRTGQHLESLWDRSWRIAPAAHDPVSIRAPRQRAAIEWLAERAGTATEPELHAEGFDGRILKALEGKGLIESFPVLPTPVLNRAPSPLTLTAEQAIAARDIRAALGRFEPFLLHGITGSGKTEVYLNAIDAALERGGQALVLIPEIALTPQTLRRFEQRFGAAVAYHSGLGDRERGQVWASCRAGQARVLIGTRSAIFVPFAHLAIIVVDEEHDGSFKQQDGFRYSARDLAAIRARDAAIPVVFGTATPALETLHNARIGRYRHLRLHERTGVATRPDLRIIDVRGQTLDEGLCTALLGRMRSHLDAGHQALVFINRRGYAPSFLCTRCGWIATCERCDTRFTLHTRPPGLRCHHCDSQLPIPQACPACGNEALRPIGFGTQRAEQALMAAFPDVPVVRIDRDTTRSARHLTARLELIETGRPAVLVGTQMLAKGHHFPRVTLVAVLNADGGFASPDFRAPEHTAQLIEQVAGRAGRAEHPGEVFIQTFDPENPTLQALVQSGYDGFAETELSHREVAGLPPFRALALLRAEASSLAQATHCLDVLTRPLRTRPGLEIWGPAPAPMARRADRLRAQCALLAPDRPRLSRLLAHMIEAGAKQRFPGIRWSVDVDPYDMV